MNIKVLPLSGVMALDPEVYGLTFEDMFWDKDRIEPVFHRNGQYFDRKTGEAWCEWFGNAVKTSARSFRHELDTYHASELNARQIAALQAVVNQRMATNKQKDMLSLYWHAMRCRDIRRNARRFRCR